MKKILLNRTNGIFLTCSLILSLLNNNLKGQQTWTCSAGNSGNANQAQNSVSQPTDCINFLKDFIPSATDSVLEVRIKMYVFTPSVGIGTWDNATTLRAKHALRIVDSVYSHIAVNQLTLFPANPTQIPHAKVKFVLVGNLNVISDHSTYTYVPSAIYNPAYNDPTAINVYYGCAIPINPPSLPLQYGAHSWVDPPYPNNHIFMAHGIPGSNVQYDLGVDDPWAYVLAHEIGHALGLDHSTMINPNVDPYRGYSYVNSAIGCCQQIHADDYRLENPPLWNPCGTPNSSNNLMSEASGCMQYLSPQQMAIIHFNLRTSSKGWLTNKGYADATTRNASSDYFLTTNETWTSDRHFKGNIRVKADKTLTVKCTVSMTKNSRIIVEPGAQLIIDGGTITNISGNLWDGICLMGNPFMPQLTANTNNSGAVLYQGMLRIKNGGTISQASVGVRNYLSTTGNSGGVIFAQNANFLNNVIDVQMSGQYMSSFTPIPSASWFYNCNFKTTGAVGNNSAPTNHVYLLNVSGVKFMGCVFQCTVSPISSPGNGIYSIDAVYTVDKNGSTPCKFENLVKGVYVNNINPLKTPVISNSQFINNLYGGYFMNSNYLNFQTNTLTTTSGVMVSGVYLNNCKYYKIKSNQFLPSTSYAASGEGVTVYKSKTGAHEIYRNKFSNLLVGINCMDDNGNPNNNTDGLKMNCNDFHITPNAYDVVLSYSTGLALPLVNKTQGSVLQSAQAMDLVRNIYGANCGNQNKWQIYSGSTVTINHGANSNSTTACTQPTLTGCKSPSLNVQDKGIPLNYPSHCPENPQSSGGTNTLSTNRLTSMNDYISSLTAQRAADIANSIVPNDFELQSTVSSKLNLFLTDSLTGNPDSVVALFENNQGYMEDADIQTVFAYINKGDFATAQHKTDALGSDRSDWKSLLSQVISFLPDTVNGINNISGTYASFFRDYANSSDMDGKPLAQALLQASSVNYYSEPHALPEGVSSARLMVPQSQYIATENPETDFHIEVYPNPTNKGITINYRGVEEGTVKIELKDLLGKVIYTNFNNSRLINQYISLDSYKSGMYLLSLTKDKELIYTTKIIKED